MLFRSVTTLKYQPKRGKLIGALAVNEGDEIMAITSAGGVIRTEVSQIRPSSRSTMGVRLVNLPDGVELLAIDKNVEEEGEEEAEAVAKGDVAGPTERAQQKAAEAGADTGDTGDSDEDDKE